MCGIAGFVYYQDHKLLAKICSSMQHRGPDSTGYYEDDRVSLGVTRLRIIDLATGDQPIHNEDDTVWIVFNGEIFNFGQLRLLAESRGHRFYTDSDTEVLVHLWEEYGPHMVAELRGMFAFAIYDATRRRLFIARDRFGEKPLYYTWLGGAFFFASELNALLTLETLKRIISKDALAHYLTFFYNPLQTSMLEGVYRLPPGQTITIDLDSAQIRHDQYWDLQLSPKLHVDEQAVLDRLDSLLREAVKLKLVSDVPIGVLLSGGVDSSVVTGVASGLLENLQTFHVTFEGEGSEAKYARMVSERFGTDHHEYWLESDFFKDLSRIASFIDEPIADASVLPTYHVCRALKKHVTVCLTGLGADELFWGYPWLQDYRDLDRWFSLPASIRRIAYVGAQRLRARPTRLLTDLARYERFGYSKLDVKSRCILRLSHFSPQELKQSGISSSCHGTFATRMQNIDDDKDARAYLTAKEVLPNEYLHKDDRLSMAHSLELRNPFLDHLLAEWVARLPHEYKIGSEPKYVLKRFAVTRLGIPKRAIYRRKTGFTIPLYGHHSEMISAIENLRSRFDLVPKALFDLVGRSPPSYENSARAFALLMLLEWAAQLQPN